MPDAKAQTSDEIVVFSQDNVLQDDLEDLARTLGRHLVPGNTILLHGDLGAGKTTFARALIQARLQELGNWEDVPSPSFTLVQQYQLETCEIWHVDLYRLTDPDEAFELGLQDAFDEAICLIEWPNRLGTYAPSGALYLHLTPNADESRNVQLTAKRKSGAADLIGKLKLELGI